MKLLVLSFFAGGILMLAGVQLMHKQDVKEERVVYKDKVVFDSSANETLKSYINSNKTQIEKIQKEQGELNASIETLNQRLKNVLDNLALSNEKSIEEQVLVENGETETYSSGRKPFVSEKQLSHYVDAVIENEGWDENTTNKAWEQTHQILETMPGVMLDDMQCAANICRAKFARIDGQMPDIDNIWGNPPFMSEGFTIPQNDGSVILYFTGENSSVDDFREMASLGGG